MPPLYSYKCAVCDHVTDAVREVEERNSCPNCKHCNSEETYKIISQDIRSTVLGHARKGNYNSGDYS